MSVGNYIVVQVALQDVTSDGTLVPANTKGPRNAEMRVLPRDGCENSSDSPTVETYIERELAAGRSLIHFDGRLIITGVTYSDCIGVTDCKTFSNPNVDEALVATSALVRGVMLQAHPDNSGKIWISIGAAAVADKGICLQAGDPPFLVPVSDLALVHALTELAADKLLYLAR